MHFSTWKCGIELGVWLDLATIYQLALKVAVISKRASAHGSPAPTLRFGHARICHGGQVKVNIRRYTKPYSQKYLEGKL